MMEGILTDNDRMCFTLNRRKTLCGCRLSPDIPLTFISVIKRAKRFGHDIACPVCHERWENMDLSRANLKSRIQTDEYVFEEYFEA